MALAAQDHDQNPAAIAKINAQIEALYRQHAATLLGIDTKLIQQQRQGWTSLFSTIENDFTTNITKMLEGTETFSQGMRNLFLQVGDAVIQTLVKMGVQWAATMIENKILGQGTAEAQIAASAGEAGAAGVASFAGAPWPVDVGAPAFGAAMAAAAEGFSVAEQGFDVPKGLNPVTQLHSGEMVLPEKYADTIRRLEGGRRDGAGEAHLHFHTPDPTTFASWAKQNPRQMREVLRKALPNRVRR